MKTSPETLVGRATLPVNEFPAATQGCLGSNYRQTPEWEQFPLEKREELVRILGGMLVRQVEAQGVSHEQPS